MIPLSLFDPSWSTSIFNNILINYQEHWKEKVVCTLYVYKIFLALVFKMYFPSMTHFQTHQSSDLVFFIASDTFCN